MNMEIDVRHVLSAIRVPDARAAPLRRLDDDRRRQSRYLAERIAGAKLVELPGIGSLVSWAGDTEPPLRRDRSVPDGGMGGAAWEAPSRTACSRRCSSPTSSAPPRRALRARRRALARAAPDVTTRLIRRRARALSRNASSTRPATGSSRSFDGPARAIRCACGDHRRRARARASRCAPACTLASASWIDDKVGGIAVQHRRAGRRTRPAAGEVLVSSTVKDLVAGSGIEFRDRGVAELKGVPGEWRLFAVERLAEASTSGPSGSIERARSVVRGRPVGV